MPPLGLPAVFSAPLIVTLSLRLPPRPGCGFMRMSSALLGITLPFSSSSSLAPCTKCHLLWLGCYHVWRYGKLSDFVMTNGHLIIFPLFAKFLFVLASVQLQLSCCVPMFRWLCSLPLLLVMQLTTAKQSSKGRGR
uniref:Uncharacterized protein n=2 Tax=Opuntia streptacantha TaxID=393608 RepID=A0A7C9D2X6_OPUST